MFKEIAKLLNTTGINLDISSVSETEIKVVIVPKPKDGKNATMCPPLILTATPAELDEKIGETLVQYIGGVRSLEDAVADSLLVMEATAKIARESAAAKKTTPSPAAGSASVEEHTDSDGGVVEEEAALF